MKYVNSILVWQLSEANKGTKVETSASAEEHNRRLPLSMATWHSTLMFSPLQYSLTSSDCAQLTDTSAVSALVSSGSKSLPHFAFAECAYLITRNNILVEKNHNNNASGTTPESK